MASQLQALLAEARGLVVGLDYRQTNLDVHELLQQLKLHPLIRPYLEGGEMVEWGAKTIPEGGLYSIPDRLHGNGLLIAGDAAGFVNVAALKGIHHAMYSGILAARAAFRALAEAHPAIMTRSELADRIWGDEPPASDALATHIYSLRQVLDRPFETPMLKTLHGVGFRLEVPE